MKILAVSDLHFEFTQDAGQELVKELSKDCDILIVAGDLSNYANLARSYDNLCSNYKRVIHVPGNHEYYGATKDLVNEVIEQAEHDNPNLTVLDNKVVEIEGQRFVGSSLWFEKTKMAKYHQQFWSDFTCIRDGASWIYNKNWESKTFLTATVREGDYVITHHMPSNTCVNVKFEKDETNCYFVCSMDKLIEERKPKVWQSGHTHCSFDFQMYSTRMLCNPFGYWKRQENWEFQPNLIVEL
jgi:Icc-related predicted phosphoesterase